MSDSDIERLKEYVMPNGKYSNIRANSALIKKYFPTIYEEIKDDYKTKLYMLLHDIKEVPKCMNPTCNNKVKLENIGAGFRKCCCNACVGQYQKTDLQFANKISLSKKENNKDYFKIKYPDINFSYSKENNNYCIIKNYCKHGDITLYSNTFDRLYKDKKCLCVECNKELIDTYIPTDKEIQEFQNVYHEFHKKNSLAYKENWFLTHYPKEYKIILYWSKHINDILLPERIYLFRNKLSEPPKCLREKCNNKTHFNHSQNCYTVFCDSYNCQVSTSKAEIEIYEFLKKYDDSTELNFILNSKKFDIIVKSKKLVVEHNGLWFHGDAIKNKENEKSYHLDRYNLLKTNGYSLFNIWGDEWQYKQDIIKSMLLYKIGKSSLNINARECIIKEIKETRDFLNTNHLQGWCQSSINIGLYYNDELVSLMTFGKRSISKKRYNFELLRFCNKLNTNVRGGASKLFTYFKNNYKNIEKINTFASCDYSNGKLYDFLGFKEKEHTGLNFWWSDTKNRFCRNKFMKHKLIEEGFDPTKTEDEIMRERGYMKIWGTGNLKYEYTNIR